MAYTVESINGCTKKIIFNFDSLDLTDQVQEAVKEKRKKVSIKGFRKGTSAVAATYRHTSQTYPLCFTFT